VQFSADKKPEDATTAQQIADMYKNQEQIKNQKKPFDADDDEEVY
jgi:DNA ligase-1